MKDNAASGLSQIRTVVYLLVREFDTFSTGSGPMYGL